MRGSNTDHGFLDRAIEDCLCQMDPKKAHKLAQMMYLMFPTPLTIDQKPVRRTEHFRKYSRLVRVHLKEGHQTYECDDKPKYY